MNTIETLRFEWQDAKRARKIPVKAYFSKNGDTPSPVIIFSHGLGGSREDYSYLGRHWAENGYISFHLQHLGSDSSIWQHAPAGTVSHELRQAAAKPDNTSNRIQDVTFGLDQLSLLNKETGLFQNRLDLDRIGMAGHSFGALTTLALAGEVFTTPSGHQITSPDLRIKAGLAISAPLPKNKAHWDSAYSNMRLPCLHLTGTEDTIAIGESPAEDRRVPFDQTRGAEAWLITLTGADHMVFVGLKRNAARAEADAKIHELIKKCSVVYWDALLRQNPTASAQFRDANLTQLLGHEATFETKNN